MLAGRLTANQSVAFELVAMSKNRELRGLDIFFPDLPAGRGELILVADDELALREMARMTLEQFGYRVCCAADGAEALALFTERQHEISAVVTDLMMPFMDGVAAISAIREINPRVSFI